MGMHYQTASGRDVWASRFEPVHGKMIGPIPRATNCKLWIHIHVWDTPPAVAGRRRRPASCDLFVTLAWHTHTHHTHTHTHTHTKHTYTHTHTHTTHTSLRESWCTFVHFNFLPMGLGCCGQSWECRGILLVFHGLSIITIYSVLSYGTYLLFLVVVGRPLLRELGLLHHTRFLVRMVEWSLRFRLCIPHGLSALHIRHRRCRLTVWNL